MRLLTEPVTIVARTLTAVGGGHPEASEVRTETTCAFRRRLSRDEFDLGLNSTEEWLLYLTPDVSIRPGDHIIYAGEHYEVVSEPFPAVRFRTGEVHHTETRVRRSSRGRSA